MEKVRLTKREAKALEGHLSWYPDKQDAIENYINYSEFWHLNNLPLKEMGFDKYVECLYLGYEVEQSKEERLVEFYNHLPIQLDGIGPYRKGIYQALEILGIKIEGIND